MRTPPPRKSASLITLASVTRVVEQACRADYPVDPLLTTDLSRVISQIMSMIKRHGPLLEDACCDALLGSGCYDVERRVRLPITALGRAASISGTRADLPLEGEVVDVVEVDILAIDLRRRCARAVQMKRGLGRTDTRKRRQLEADLRAAERTLLAFARSRGHDIDSASVAIADIYGNSAFSSDLTLRGGDLDAAFGVPVILNMEMTTAALRAAMTSMLPEMIAALASMNQRRGLRRD